MTTNKYNEALKYADDKFPAASREAPEWVQIAKADEGLGLPEKALACYMVASRLDPKDSKALAGAAKIYNILDQPESALNYANKSLKLNFSVDATWEYARACIKLNRGADAEKALEKVIQADTGNAIASRELSVIYFNDKEFALAVPLLRKSYALHADAQVAYMLGTACLESNDLNCALDYLKEAVMKNPSFYNADLNLARAYFKKDKFLAAASEYEKINSKVDLTAMDNYNRAISNEKISNPDLAFKAYVAAAEKFGVSKEPEALKSHVKAGMGFHERKNDSAAIAHFQIVVDADPEAATISNIYSLLADSYVGAGNPDQAIAILEKAIALDNRNVEICARLADLYKKNNQQDKARQVCGKMTSLSPKDPHVHQASVNNQEENKIDNKTFRPR